MNAPLPSTATDSDSRAASPPPPARIALLGNPNTGKTTVFNRLCGIRAKTANFPGSTVEARIGVTARSETRCHVVDLPGIYGLNLDRPESLTCKDYLRGRIELGPPPEAVLVVVDATNLGRNLILVSQAVQLGLPAVVALNMTDLARRRGVRVDHAKLAALIGCPVVPISARSGDGFDDLVAALDAPRLSDAALPDGNDARAATAWAAATENACVERDAAAAGRADRHTDRIDALFTHPIFGLLSFVVVMSGLFYTIFALATLPMDLIELLFAQLGGFVGAVVPPGAIHDLLVDGVVSGVAGTLVFLPQICLLFFLISLLEDTGYLSRAVFVLDRSLRRFGLPGQAFVPLLSAHACAIPAIMSARLIPDVRQRIATILVAPLMSCSARLPVYVLLVGILFPEDPLAAGIAFTGCYALGAVAGLTTALICRRTILRGPSQPMVLELPTYKLPSLRTALTTTLDRAWMFLRKAGTVIVAICVVLWWLSAYPKTPEPSAATVLRAEASITADAVEAASLSELADEVAGRHAMAQSFAGRLGRTVQPVFAPIGLDWQLTVGVVTSFAAREVFVSTLAVLVSGSDNVDDAGVLQRIRTIRRDDGTAVLTTRTAASLLVFYVLAMQCLPTLPVTAREAGHWGWALLQLGYMTLFAYVAALLLHTALGLAGVA